MLGSGNSLSASPHKMARNEVSKWLGGVGYGACVTGGADNLVAMARLMWDTGGVYSVSDVCSGYPRGQVHVDFCCGQRPIQRARRALTQVVTAVLTESFGQSEIY